MKNEKFEPSLRLTKSDSALYAIDCAEHILYALRNSGGIDLRAKEVFAVVKNYIKEKAALCEVETLVKGFNALVKEVSDEKQRSAAKACLKAVETAIDSQALQECCDFAVSASDNQISESEWQYERYIEYLSAEKQ